VFLVARYPGRSRGFDLVDRRGLGSRAHLAPRRACDRARPSVHPHQRHDRRRAGGLSSISVEVGGRSGRARLRGRFADRLFHGTSAGTGSCPHSEPHQDRKVRRRGAHR
jgi:hypothetical protein